MKDHLIGTTEAARILGISRIAVFKKIKKGHIEAYKVGRNYVIDRRSLTDVEVRSRSWQRASLKMEPSPKRPVKTKVKKDISDAVGKALRQYAEALKGIDHDQ